MVSDVAYIELVLRVQNAAYFVVDLTTCLKKSDPGNNRRFIGTFMVTQVVLAEIFANRNRFFEEEEASYMALRISPGIVSREGAPDRSGATLAVKCAWCR
jgi:hypothetical protein